MQPPSYPLVMCFSGHDATGGAGLVADLETLVSIGCRPSPIVTAVTVQDTVNVRNFTPVDPDLLAAQAQTVLADMKVAAFKIGMLGSAENVEAVYRIIRDYPQHPVVLDPILRAGGGTPLADQDLVAALRELLLPLATVVTPNGPEARILAPEADTLDACAQQILEWGCRYVLITGGHEATDGVVNTLYAAHRPSESFSWTRLPEIYHGSGCTLAAAIAGLLALGLEPFTAVHEAQEYTWTALQRGYPAGRGQWLPDRLFWSRDGGTGE